MTTIALAFLASSAFAGPRIVNGVEAGPDEFPEVVGININNGGTCTGSLVHAEWVLTAAHCFDSIDVTPIENEDGTFTYSDANTVVYFGNVMGPSAQRTIAADKVVVHPEYVSLPSGELSLNGLGPFPVVDGYDNMTNDVALIHLSEPANGTVMAVNASPIDDTWLGADVTHIGFGITQFGGSDSGIKRYAVVPVYSYTGEHSASEPANNGGISFFDAESGRSTCQGDSGGPGVFYQGSGYSQVGITSYGIECGTGLGTKMRVDLHIPWIEETSGITLVKAPNRPATFYCSHQLNEDSKDSIAIGTVPMDLQCIVDSGDPETIEKITWYWGDGSEAEEITNKVPYSSPRVPDVTEITDIEASHVYDTMGVYNLRACIAGVRGKTEDSEGVEYEDCIFKASHVNACDVPVASFDATPVDGLRIDLRNTTSLRAHNCVSNAVWEVYEGATPSGEPVISLSGWQPELTLDAAGTYTVVLNVGGLGGTGAAGATVEVGRGSGCSNTGLAPMLAPLAFAPLMFGFRRRR